MIHKRKKDSHTRFRAKFERRSARINAIAKELGAVPLDDTRIQAIYERCLERRASALRTDDARFAGCQSVTAVETQLGMRRRALIEWLAHEGWMVRDAEGWRPTEPSLNAGWIVLRGRRVVCWPQITPSGVHEIARRIGIAPGGSSYR